MLDVPKGFTLIELLIVVAIIAILAAIAVPNFLEAQVRAKVSRCKEDMRSIAVALEAYRTDWPHYPPDGLWYGWVDGWPAGTAPAVLLHVLTTPTAYMTSIPENVFPNNWFGVNEIGNKQYRYVSEGTFLGQWGRLPPDHTTPNLFVAMWGKDIGVVWCLDSAGPDRYENQGYWYIFGGEEFLNHLGPIAQFRTHQGCIYDPSNGTISDGDIIRAGP